MKDIAIYGAGGFGREVACLIKNINAACNDDCNRWNLIGFFDDGLEKGSENEYGKILGGIDELNSWNTELAIALGFGSPENTKKIINSINNPNIVFPNVISPDTKFFDKDNFFIGKGNVICAECLFSCNVHIGDFNVFNFRASVAHDSQIGNFNVLMPDVKISGRVKMGDGNLFGVGSAVIQMCKIGNEAIISSNSVLYGNAKDGKTYMGNPAKKIKIF